MLEDQSAILHVNLDHVTLFETTAQQLARDRRFEQSLYRSAQRSGTIDWVKALQYQILLHRLGQAEADLLFAQAPHELTNLKIDDLGKILHGQRIEEDDLINAIEKLRAEGLLERLIHLTPFLFEI